VAAVDPAYVAKPPFAVMMAPSTATLLRKSKDSQNRYLWEMSLQAPGAEMLFGHRVILNGDMEGPTATNKRVVLAGDFSAYYIDDAGPTVFIRDDSVRVLNHQSVFPAMKRSDGALTNTAAVKYLRTA
jgi:HK97 family phage major capsid protein